MQFEQTVSLNDDPYHQKTLRLTFLKKYICVHDQTQQIPVQFKYEELKTQLDEYLKENQKFDIMTIYMTSPLYSPLPVLEKIANKKIQFLSCQIVLNQEQIKEQTWIKTFTFPQNLLEQLNDIHLVFGHPQDLILQISEQLTKCQKLKEIHLESDIFQQIGQFTGKYDSMQSHRQQVRKLRQHIIQIPNLKCLQISEDGTRFIHKFFSGINFDFQNLTANLEVFGIQFKRNLFKNVQIDQCLTQEYQKTEKEVFQNLQSFKNLKLLQIKGLVVFNEQNEMNLIQLLHKLPNLRNFELLSFSNHNKQIMNNLEQQIGYFKNLKSLILQYENLKDLEKIHYILKNVPKLKNLQDLKLDFQKIQLKPEEKYLDSFYSELESLKELNELQLFLQTNHCNKKMKKKMIDILTFKLPNLKSLKLLWFDFASLKPIQKNIGALLRENRSLEFLQIYLQNVLLSEKKEQIKMSNRILIRLMENYALCQRAYKFNLFFCQDMANSKGSMMFNKMCRKIYYKKISNFCMMENIKILVKEKKHRVCLKNNCLPCTQNFKGIYSNKLEGGGGGGGGEGVGEGQEEEDGNNNIETQSNNAFVLLNEQNQVIQQVQQNQQMLIHQQLIEMIQQSQQQIQNQLLQQQQQQQQQNK